MEKLELLTPYLPYLLKCLRKDGYTTILVPFNHTESINNGITIDYLLENEFKPILHPLSDLFKREFTHLWQSEIDTESLEALLEQPIDYEFLMGFKFSQSFMNEIFKNHFDFFGLIEKGLAIDINNLK